MMVRITIDVSEKEMDAIEDTFFAELSEEEYTEIRPILVRFWGRLCKAVDEGKRAGKNKKHEK